MTNLSFLQKTAVISNEKLVTCYESDAARFAQIVADPDFARVVGAFIRNGPPDSTNVKPHGEIPESIRESRLIDANLYSKWLWEVIAASQVAVCCDLFQGNSIHLDSINEDNFRAFARNGVQKFLQTGPAGPGTLSKQIEVSDGIRIMTLLRCTGLFQRTSSSVRQLSLGANDGARDLDALHAKIWLQPQQTPPDSMSATKGTSATFKSEYGCPEHVVLVDGADNCKEFYQKLNAQDTGSRFGNRILALNELLDNALNSILDAIECGTIRARNLIAAFRIDPRMIPDLEVLFSKLLNIMDAEADLIVTIGAGNDANEFRNRVDKMDELTRYLEARALEPWRIRLYNANIPEGQRRPPLFGNPGLMSYEILYCKLKKINLE